MDFYFGVDLLHHLQKHYEPRLPLLFPSLSTRQISRYFWLFKELECRVTTLRKILVMISALAGLHVPADGGTGLCDGSQFDILLVF